MSFLIYQRADPRFKEWIPLTSQQIRLRNLIQIIGINFDLNQNGTHNAREIYFTLHITPMSAPFFTSEKTIPGRYFTWKEIEPRQFPEYIRLSSPGCVIRIWSADGKEIASWGLHFKGLHYLGHKGDWNSRDFKRNTLLFRMPFGVFTTLDSLQTLPSSILRHVQIEMPKHMVKDSYTVKSLASLHRISRTLLEERELGRKLKLEIGLYGYSTDYSSSSDTTSISPSYGNIHSKLKTRMQQGKIKLKLKEEIESLKLRIVHLSDEKGRSEGRVQRLKRESMMVDDISDELLSRIQALAKEKQRLHELKELVQDNKQRYSQMSSQLFTRKKQLISELLLFYPISLVGGAKRYSINEVQLPNAEDYGSEGGGHISVSLGYTAHMLVTLAFFLGIPLRYPIQHFGSRSRIVDHITIQIPDKEREFPLYFRKEDVYSKYAVYLLNKNIAQIRWYCGLSTLDLRATLPNLYNLLTSRLLIPGWPPNPNESLEMATEITEEIDQEFYRNDTNLSLSLDQGLDQIGPNKNIDIDNVWLRYSGSYSDLEFAGGNVVPSSEIKHGKAQDRFLTIWKKKTYSESEDIDGDFMRAQRWLTNSLNLEYDVGSPKKRPSITSTSPPPPFLLVSSDDSSDSSAGRKQRRVGRVDIPVFNKNRLHPPSATINTNSSSSPATNIRKLENQINEIERRKSFCDTGRGSPSRKTGVIEIGDRGISDSPNQVLETLPHHYHSKITHEDKFDEALSDVVRKVSLVEMQLQRNKNREESSSLGDSGNWGSVRISPKLNQREYSRTPGCGDFKTLREHEILNTESPPPPTQDPNSQVNTNSITEPEANENNSESVENLIPYSPERVCEDQTNPEEVNTPERNYPEEIVNEDTQKKLESEDTDQASNNAIDNNNQRGVEIEEAKEDEDTPMSSSKSNKDESKEQPSDPTNADSDLEEYNKQVSSFLSEFCDNNDGQNGEEQDDLFNRVSLLSNKSFNLVKRRLSESNN